jgi:multidrug efflux pump
MNITQTCVRKPVFAWMLMAGTILFGIIALSRIGISQFPDVDFPTISIGVSWEGAAPEVVEHDVVEILEEAVSQVEGVRSITSTSRQGSANVTVELDLSRNVDLALQDVQTKISRAARNLPVDIDPPVVSKSNPEDNPIMWIGVSGPFPQQLISDVARYQVKEKLQTLPGVGEITLGGWLERNVRIWIDATKLDAQHLTVNDVASALRREHVELPAGRLENSGREVSVRVMGEALDLDALNNIIIRDTPGAEVYLKDVALVEDGFEDVRRVTRVNGSPAMGLGIRKQRGANAVAVAEAVKAQMVEIQKTLPDGMELGVNFDSTVFIAESVHEIELELILSVILTALVCWIFLGSISNAINVILAIPMSLLGTIAVIYFLGFTLNTFTLLALALAVGIVVDDAIMVLENIVRHAEMGKDRVTAALEGTKEITFSAFSATLAVVAIFVPVVFMEGVIGKFFLQFGITLCVAILLSYLEAVTLAPARCSQILDVSREHRSKLGARVDSIFNKLETFYSGTLVRVLKRPGTILSGAVVVFALSLVVLRGLPSEFVPSQDQSRLMVRLQTAVSSSMTETDHLFKQVEEKVTKYPQISRSLALVGGFGGGGGMSGGILFLTLVDPSERQETQNEFAAILRKDLNGIPGVRAVVQDLSQSGFTAQRGFPIEFSILGPDWPQLEKLSGEITQKLEASGLAIDVDTDYRIGVPELRISPDRGRCADLGISVEDVATSINTLIGGERVGKYSAGGRRVDVRMRLLADQRRSVQDISRLRARSRTGDLVPLSSLITYEELPALQAITRKDRERAISVFANVAPGHSQQEAIDFVESLTDEMPPGYRTKLSGSSVAFKESFSGLVFAMIMGILVAYMVLASQFNSFSDPVTILTILPLSIVGAAIALLLAGKSLNIFSMIGLLLLMGIVKKNSIILVDYANQRRTGSASDAMRVAGPIRLRPILMTSVATIMAAIPPALGIGPGTEIRSPMAIAVIGGVFVSTALSLLVVPAFYVKLDNWIASVGRMFRKSPKPQPVETTSTA